MISIEAEIAALEALARDELPKSVTVQSLFDVDLANENDVVRRVADPRRSIASGKAELAAMLAIETDVTERVMAGLRHAGIKPPAALHRWVDGFEDHGGLAKAAVTPPASA
jgi:hypothetical protein